MEHLYENDNRKNDGLKNGRFIFLGISHKANKNTSSVCIRNFQAQLDNGSVVSKLGKKA